MRAFIEETLAFAGFLLTMGVGLFAFMV